MPICDRHFGARVNRTQREDKDMTTLYTRTWDLKESLSDTEVNEFWRLCVDELLPACEKLDGTRSIKLYSGAGALRADLTVAWEMDDASVYEQALHNPELRALIGRFYAAIDMRSTDQRFQREITPELVHALSG
jgi:hypothetical protein